MQKTIKIESLGTLGKKSRFTYGGVEWVALNMHSNMTLCIAADVLKCRSFDEENKNYFGASSLRAYLNGEFLDNLVAAGADREDFAPLMLELTSDDGLRDYGRDTVEIGLISCDMYRDFRHFIPDTSVGWWTCTPDTVGESGYENQVRIVSTLKTLSNYNAHDGDVGVRPLCALKSNALVSFNEGNNEKDFKS